MLNRIVVLLLVCLWPYTSIAADQNPANVVGFVVNVSDDCQLIVSIDNRAEIVRLAGIDLSNEDSREIRQARDLVRSRVLDKTVRIELLGRDPQGNIIGRIYIGESCLNEVLINAGLAAKAL